MFVADIDPQCRKTIGNNKPDGLLSLEKTMWTHIMRVAEGTETVFYACREIERALNSVKWASDDYKGIITFFAPGKNVSSPESVYDVDGLS